MALETPCGLKTNGFAFIINNGGKGFSLLRRHTQASGNKPESKDSYGREWEQYGYKDEI